MKETPVEPHHVNWRKDGWRLAVRKLKKKTSCCVGNINDSNWQKLMRCRKELDTLCTQTGESVGPKDMEFNTSSSFKNNQE